MMQPEQVKSVEQVLTEPSPATVNYRTVNNRRPTLQKLIDSPDAMREIKGSKTKKDVAKKGKKLNWVNGVFIPVLLNIWGVIMFLRLGWVVGQAGIWQGTAIIIAANVVTFLTALSLCAICTNGEVKGGGVYFLISRALGPVHGGTIGLLFFIAQAVAVSLYVVGFSESVVSLMQDQGLDYFTGDETNDTRVIGFVTSTMLFLMSLIGIGWYAKTQTGLLIVLIVAILSVLIGAFLPGIPDLEENEKAGFIGFQGIRNLESNYEVEESRPEVEQGFFTVFAVFFPAVTGIMAGANLSGDLDDPSVAIPKGTLYAIVLTCGSYIVLLWFLGITCYACAQTLDTGVLECDFNLNTSNVFNIDLEGLGGLLYDPLIIRRISVFEPLVYLGVFAATLSSALASLVGAPRILQSVASDKIFPFKVINVFSYGRGETNEPILGYILTYFITLGCVGIGNLDLLAPIISNLFMISYALTNYACFESSRSNAPNWRPSFKYYNKYASLFGTAICVVVMFFIDVVPAIVTIAFAIAVWCYLQYLKPDINWGEALEAIKYNKALDSLETLQLSEKVHVKTFRPQFLVMTGKIYERIWLVKFTSLFQSGGGVMICADVIPRKDVKVLHPSFDKINGFGDGNDDSTVASSSEATGNGRDDAIEGTTAQLSGDREEDRFKHTSVRNLFVDPSAVKDTELSITETSEVNSLGSNSSSELANNSSKLATQTARFLGAELELVKQRRKEADSFLKNKLIWSRKKCKGAFYEAIISSSLFSGFQKLLQLTGIGKMRPNTVVIGFKSDYLNRSLEEIADYERLVRAALSAHIGLLIVRDDQLTFDINMKKVATSLFPRPVFMGKDTKNDDISDKAVIEANLFNQEFQQELSSKEQTKQEMTYVDLGAKESSAMKPAMDFKERVKKYQLNDHAFIGMYEKSLPTEVKGDHIDVWWLADDGGLTMLLPQLLIENPIFKKKKLRVMAVTNKLQSTEETSRLKKTELRMVHLLNKFRIKASTIGVDLNLDQQIHATTKQRFERCLGVQMDELDDTERMKTQRNLRIAEEIRKLSKGAAMVFVILPIPDINLRVKLHTTWLDMMSFDMPPMVMMRGNNENVLTFFC